MRGRVLVVDDDALIRRVGEKFLARAGFEVATAGSTWEGRFLAATGRFDAAILDYFLNDELGCDLIAPLRASNPAIRIAVVSGLSTQPEVARHALAAGADIVASKTRIDWVALAAGDPPPPALPARRVVDLDALRREAIHGTLLVHGRNISHAARALGMTRSSLQRVLRKIPLPALDDEPEPTGSRK
jgi:ActR/RegA family two-component response regulator